MIYVIRNNQAVKIGYSKDPGRRLEEHQISNYETLTLEYVIRANGFTVRDYEKLERELQEVAEKLAGGRARKSSEWFFLSDRQVRRILKRLKGREGIFPTTVAVYVQACETVGDKFEYPQLYTTRFNAAKKGSVKLTQQDIPTKDIIGSFLDLLGSASYRISYAAIAERTEYDEDLVRDVMRREGFTKILIEHNEGV